MPSRQRAYGGGKFRSERQRRAIWANSPTIGHIWAHRGSAKGRRREWAKVGRGAATHTGRSKSANLMRVGAIGVSGLRPRPSRGRAGRRSGVKAGSTRSSSRRSFTSRGGGRIGRR